MSARLHVLLGAGGVGKTTLAAGYALALARGGARVGLLGIDPALRLGTALGLDLGAGEAVVPGSGSLRAALLSPEETLRRWAIEASPDATARQRLFANPFFVALADRLASATDLLAAARVAEWVERDPELAHLVVDTAPGLGAVEFLRRPERIAALLEGRLVALLRRLGRQGVRRAPHGIARRVLAGVMRIGGSALLLDLAELIALAEALLAKLLERVERARRWLADPSTEILLVAAVRTDAADIAERFAAALEEVGLEPSAAVLNRALPPGLGAHLAGLDVPDLPDARALVRYARAYATQQAEVAREAGRWARRVVTLPSVRGLDGAERHAALGALGEALRAGLAARQ
ncbi:MAG: hypothetical protein HY908_14980 [Myxococcales bacterium]|nr:hypothetical protein [Myxococcales bacterium]